MCGCVSGVSVPVCVSVRQCACVYVCMCVCVPIAPHHCVVPVRSACVRVLTECGVDSRGADGPPQPRWRAHGRVFDCPRLPHAALHHRLPRQQAVHVRSSRQSGDHVRPRGVRCRCCGTAVGLLAAVAIVCVCACVCVPACVPVCVAADGARCYPRCPQPQWITWCLRGRVPGPAPPPAPPGPRPRPRFSTRAPTSSPTFAATACGGTRCLSSGMWLRR